MKADLPGMEVDVLFKRDEGRSEHMYGNIRIFSHEVQYTHMDFAS